MDAYKILQKMTLGRNINSSVIRAVRARLIFLLDERKRKFVHWEEHISHKMNPTRQKEVRRKFEKIIKAYEIVIYDLTPFFERVEDLPPLIDRKKK